MGSEARALRAFFTGTSLGVIAPLRETSLSTVLAPQKAVNLPQRRKDAKLLLSFSIACNLKSITS
jgi:hypothetical protein